MRPAVLVLALGACIPKIDPGPVPVEEAAAPVDVLELRDDASPNLYLHAVVRAGSAWDPPGQEGLAHLMARAMAEGGAGERSADQVREALFPTGNALDVLVSKEWVTLKLRCHRDHAELCVEVFADALTQPAFDPDEVARLRDDALYQVTEGILGDEEALGEAVLESWLYEAHPYGHPVQGRAGVLPLLEAEDVRSFYEGHVLRSTVHVGIAGAVSDPLVADLESRLEGLDGSLPPELPLPQPLAIEGRQLLVVDTQTPVTGFHFAHPIPVTRDHPDHAALVLGMTALGAHRQSLGRLQRHMRTARGLNYGNYAYPEPFVQRGWSTLPEQGALRRQAYWYVWIRPTSVDNGPFALKYAIHEVEGLVEDGLTEEEFADVQRYLLGKIPLWAQDPGRQLAYALDAVATGTPNGIDDLRNAVGDLTLDQVNTALARHIDPSRLKIVAVSGEGEALSATLIEGNATPIVYADVTPDDAQGAEDRDVAETNLNISTAHVVNAEGIFR